MTTEQRAGLKVRRAQARLMAHVVCVRSTLARHRDPQGRLTVVGWHRRACMDAVQLTADQLRTVPIPDLIAACRHQAALQIGLMQSAGRGYADGLTRCANYLEAL